MNSTPDSIEGIIILVVRWVIRTGLNFFLSMEMKREKTAEKGEAELLAQAQRGELRPQAQCASPAATT